MKAQWHAYSSIWKFVITTQFSLTPIIAMPLLLLSIIVILISLILVGLMFSLFKFILHIKFMHLRGKNNTHPPSSQSSCKREKETMSFEETELRLGLPGNGREMARKRGFHETAAETMITMADLKLEASYGLDPNPKPPPPKAQVVVGWPPIRSYRKNRLSLQKGTTCEDEISSDEQKNVGNAAAARFVKVSLDGAPYLRKVDFTPYSSYKQLSDALAKLFGPFTIGNCGSQAGGMKDFMNESKLIDLLNGSHYVPTYQDRDGDWMLVGDVPWQMFVESCKRLRIMKGKEAVGLAPRAVEKCKNYKG